MDRIMGQGKNIIRDYSAMGTSVGSHKVPHRRGMVLMEKSRHGREVMWSCPCPNSTWVGLGLCLVILPSYCFWRGTMCIGQGERPLPCPAKACSLTAWP